MIIKTFLQMLQGRESPCRPLAYSSSLHDLMLFVSFLFVLVAATIGNAILG